MLRRSPHMSSRSLTKLSYDPVRREVIWTKDEQIIIQRVLLPKLTPIVWICVTPGVSQKKT